MERPTELFPEIEPYQTGFMDTGDGHLIYYEQCGNPEGKPILYVHGGPGAGFDPKSRRFFDPAKWRVILFDQRGSAQSKPFGSLENNTTAHLVKDMRNLIKMLGIEKTSIFGGSWGSTLALAYTISHPETVSGLVLRGIFLGEKEEVEYFTNGQTALFLPEAWERFSGHVPPEQRGDIMGWYHHQITSPNLVRQRYYAEAWAGYEISMLHLNPKSQTEVDEETRGFSFVSLALMETHYFLNNCFFEEGYILNNADKIPQVPISIVQGRYDLVCPPKSAFRLHKALPWSELYMVLAGHSSSDPEIQKKLVSETDALFDKV